MEENDHETNIWYVSVFLVTWDLKYMDGVADSCLLLVGPDFTRRPVKYERFIRPMGLRYKKANVTHPELKVTVQIPIISVKKNPQNPMYTQLGVLTKGTIVEVNVSELGIVTAGGKVVWGRWAQVTNNPENDGCVNA